MEYLPGVTVRLSSSSSMSARLSPGLVGSGRNILLFEHPCVEGPGKTAFTIVGISLTVNSSSDDFLFFMGAGPSSKISSLLTASLVLRSLHHPHHPPSSNNHLGQNQVASLHKTTRKQSSQLLHQFSSLCMNSTYSCSPPCLNLYVSLITST